MKNTSNQVVLGVFLGIFAYCLVVLRTIRGENGDAFIPSIAISFGLFLGFVGIAFLVFFIHHIATSIQASQILAEVSEETFRSIENLFPEDLGEEDAPESEEELAQSGKSWHFIPALETGYIQSIDTDKLLDCAESRDTVVRMELPIGGFTIEGTPVASILAAEPPDEDDISTIAAVFMVGRQRTVDQDAAFGIRQLVDVALKSLSQGVNDTTTAVMCIDYLTAIMARLAVRRMESRFRSKNGELRVLSMGPTFETLMSDSFEQIRQNGAGNIAVLTRLLRAFETLSNGTKSPFRRKILLKHAEAVAEVAHRTIDSPFDRERLDALSFSLVTSLSVATNE
jgi:uncharacterized membrane protein